MVGIDLPLTHCLKAHKNKVQIKRVFSANGNVSLNIKDVFNKMLSQVSMICSTGSEVTMCRAFSNMNRRTSGSVELHLVAVLETAPSLLHRIYLCLHSYH